MHSVVVLNLSSPILIGIYENSKLIKTIQSEEKTSEILGTLFEDILQKYKLENIIYIKGPGSFMAIKIAYIFLKTISIVKGIKLFAADAFYFNDNSPIKAVGKLFFVKESDEITTKVYEQTPTSKFTLPIILNINDFSNNIEPEYSIDSV
ncbi:MAG: hypothetical protein GQ570_00660 [Helicobacteraceae bacterium]|nr:hypothetical protein [Helicobacteraceae bacterium]